ncbi:hypothetical protein WJX72_004658 [[Myrmecia] bisecta]|uniref:Uncharacterized protein n=1 Tax=[Myrmecia] bisecta TaxID=41462 RepID=A0AAW1QQ80_9CHLO
MTDARNLDQQRRAQQRIGLKTPSIEFELGELLEAAKQQKPAVQGSTFAPSFIELAAQVFARASGRDPSQRQLQLLAVEFANLYNAFCLGELVAQAPGAAQQADQAPASSSDRTSSCGSVPRDMQMQAQGMPPTAAPKSMVYGPYAAVAMAILHVEKAHLKDENAAPAGTSTAVFMAHANAAHTAMCHRQHAYNKCCCGLPAKLREYDMGRLDAVCHNADAEDREDCGYLYILTDNDKLTGLSFTAATGSRRGKQPAGSSAHGAPKAQSLANLAHTNTNKRCPNCGHQHGNAKATECGMVMPDGTRCTYKFAVKATAKTAINSATAPKLQDTFPDDSLTLQSAKSSFKAVVTAANNFTERTGLSVGVFALGAVHTSSSDKNTAFVTLRDTSSAETRLPEAIQERLASVEVCTDTVEECVQLGQSLLEPC